MARLFVAGATGYVGRAVVRLGRDRDQEVHAHVRPDSARLAEWQQRFEDAGALVDTTPWDREALAERFAALSPDVVFCLIGTTRRRGRQATQTGTSPETYETIDYGLTALLVKAALASPSKPRFVYLSSLGANSKSGNAYMRARGRAEDAVIQSGLAYTIARPSFITGPGRDERRPGERVGAALLDGALAGFSLLGAGRLRQRYRSITNVDLASRLLDLALDPDAAGRTVEGDGLQSRRTR